jgi:hypothetical protein
VENHIIEASIITTIVIVYSIVWWNKAIDNRTRRYILRHGVSALIGGISYAIALSYDILIIGLIALTAYPVFIYFLIRAILADRKAKQNLPHE